MPGRDFRDDPSTWNIGDQFLFGPSFLVNPVSEPSATTRHLYLPRGKWYNFWTGDAREGGRFIDASAPLQEMPIFVKSGTILPMGPVVEYAGRTPGPIELRIYRGADADFALYEDDGETYDYEKAPTPPSRFIGTTPTTPSLSAIARAFPVPIRGIPSGSCWSAKAMGPEKRPPASRLPKWDMTGGGF